MNEKKKTKFDKNGSKFDIFVQLIYENNIQFFFLQLALRWRTEKEVVVGKGQFECGNKKCQSKEDLKSWEINFGYEEQGEKKNALVKLRLCPECTLKLNYHSKKREVKRKKSLKRLSKKIDKPDEPSCSNKNDEDEVVIEEDNGEVKMTDDVDESLGGKIDDTEIWKGKIVEGVEKSREEEFEEYLADLFS